MPYKTKNIMGETIPLKKEYSSITEDGRYGLFKTDKSHSGGELWRIAGTDSWMVGHVMDEENIEYAAYMADEEIRAETAAMHEEFGF
jgi:hypothetical protein